MHIYALDEKDQVIAAYQANKRANYYCLECRSLVRRRGGFLNQVHYYHVEPNRVCRQNGKSQTHLQIQYHLQKILIGSELEKQFPSINRIADVVLEKERLIFEIQCSPIAAREVEERNRNYKSLGYQVVWILHDKTYNKGRLTAAEYFLQESPHYFTDINEEGRGKIYDQWDIVNKGHRLLSMGIREVFVSFKNFSKKELFPKKSYPQWLKQRIHTWPLFFSGDYIDHFLSLPPQEQDTFLKELTTQETQLLKESNPESIQNSSGLQKLKKAIHLAKIPYRLTMNMLLEKLSR